MSLDALVELVRGRRPVVALTGAGISTESGIPDFRSPTGIWAEYDPLVYATIDAFRRDPERVWEFYALRRRALTQAEPNDAHRALAELEARGVLRAVVTQNVDALHERAGSRDVVEMHGSLRECECLSCGVRVPWPEFVAQSHEVPRCPDCDAVLKPGVVLFGELLPAQAIERATRLAREAAVLLVVGSTLEVQPVASLPWETLDAGGAVAIVNLGPTAFDRHATLRLEGKAGEVLRAVVERL